MTIIFVIIYCGTFRFYLQIIWLPCILDNSGGNSHEDQRVFDNGNKLALLIHSRRLSQVSLREWINNANFHCSFLCCHGDML